jgi:nitroreductase
VTFVSVTAGAICDKVIVEEQVEFFDVLRERHSIRAYTSQNIESAIVQQILEAIDRAPSAGNLQAYEVYLVRDMERKAALVKAARDQEFLAQAPVVMVFCAHPALSVRKYGVRGTDLYCVQDATIACTYAMLSATALGLSTVWVGSFDEDEVRRVIGAPQAHRPVAMLPVGYSAESPEIRTRRSLTDLVHQEK